MTAVSSSSERERALVVGWFSFELMGSTAGDVIAKDVVGEWLRDAGFDPVVAMHEPVEANEVGPYDVDPEQFGLVVFVCGPIGDGPPINEYLARFPHARTLAVDVTLLQPLEEWAPFDHVVERDGSARVNADITFAAPRYDAPVVGLLLVGSQGEYPTNRHAEVEAAFRELARVTGIAVVPIDTRLDVNEGGLSSPEQIESLIGKMDAVLTTRLHGAVLALRRGVPPIAVDSVPGGSKLLAQMRHIGWPLAFDVADLDAESLQKALDVALSPTGHELARETARRAHDLVEHVRREFIAAVTATGSR